MFLTQVYRFPPATECRARQPSKRHSFAHEVRSRRDRGRVERERPRFPSPAWDPETAGLVQGLKRMPFSQAWARSQDAAWAGHETGMMFPEQVASSAANFPGYSNQYGGEALFGEEGGQGGPPSAPADRASSMRRRGPRRAICGADFDRFHRVLSRGVLRNRRDGPGRRVSGRTACRGAHALCRRRAEGGPRRGHGGCPGGSGPVLQDGQRSDAPGRPRARAHARQGVGILEDPGQPQGPTEPAVPAGESRGAPLYVPLSRRAHARSQLSTSRPLSQDILAAREKELNRALKHIQQKREEIFAVSQEDGGKDGKAGAGGTHQAPRRGPGGSSQAEGAGGGRRSRKGIKDEERRVHGSRAHFSHGSVAVRCCSTAVRHHALSRQTEARHPQGAARCSKRVAEGLRGGWRRAGARGGGRPRVREWRGAFVCQRFRLARAHPGPDPPQQRGAPCDAAAPAPAAQAAHRRCLLCTCPGNDGGRARHGRSDCCCTVHRGGQVTALCCPCMAIATVRFPCGHPRHSGTPPCAEPC